MTNRMSGEVIRVGYPPTARQGRCKMSLSLDTALPHELNTCSSCEEGSMPVPLADVVDDDAGHAGVIASELGELSIIEQHCGCAQRIGQRGARCKHEGAGGG